MFGRRRQVRSKRGTAVRYQRTFYHPPAIFFYGPSQRRGPPLKRPTRKDFQWRKFSDTQVGWQESTWSCSDWITSDTCRHSLAVLVGNKHFLACDSLMHPLCTRKHLKQSSVLRRFCLRIWIGWWSISWEFLGDPTTEAPVCRLV